MWVDLNLGLLLLLFSIIFVFRNLSGKKKLELEGKSGSERALRKMQQEDLQVASSLRRFVQVAEKSAQRAKVLYPLRRRARKLFGIVGAVCACPEGVAIQRF